MPHSNVQRSLTEQTLDYLPGEEQRIHLVRRLGRVAPQALTQTRGGVTAARGPRLFGDRLFGDQALPSRKVQQQQSGGSPWTRARRGARAVTVFFVRHLPRF